MNHIIKSVIVFSLLSLSPTVFAELVSVDVVATINRVDDPFNKTQGNFYVGQQITGTYTFDNGIVDGDASPEYGFYDLTFSNAAGWDLIAGSESLKTDPGVPGFMHSIFLDNSTYSNHLHIGSWGNRPLSNGTVIYDINMNLDDPSASALGSASLSEIPVDVNKFSWNELYISGDSFSVIAHVDSMANHNAANPNLVTYQVDATVRDVWDPTGALNNQVFVGQALSSNYVFNITTPDSEPMPEFGHYLHPAGSGEFGFDVSVGSLNFQSDATQADMNVDLYDSSYNDNYIVSMYGMNIPLGNGAVITDINIYMYDETSQMISSADLSTEAPVIGTAGWYDFFVNGIAANGEFFSFTATINNITSLNASPNGLLLVSPPTGIYDRAQSFDIALIFAANLAPVEPASLVMVLNGLPQPLTSCMPGAPNPENRQTFVCTGTPALGMGKNLVKFKAQLLDGTVLEDNLEWTMLSF